MKVNGQYELTCMVHCMENVYGMVSMENVGIVWEWSVKALYSVEGKWNIFLLGKSLGVDYPLSS